MLFFLILFGIIIFLVLISIIILLSTIKIEVKNFRFGNIKKEKNFNLKIGFYFLRKVKLFNINLDNEKIKQISDSKRFEKIDIKKIESNISINKDTLENLKYLKFKIEELNLMIYIGTEDVVLTSYIVAFIAGMIGIILPHLVTKVININYKVIPLYRNKNELNIDFDSIFSLKIINIVYMVYILLKNRSKKSKIKEVRREYVYN